MATDLAADLTDADRVAYAACPLCESTALSVVREQDWSYRDDFVAGLSPKIRWIECGSCGHQFTSGYLTDLALRVIAASAQAGQTAAGMSLDDIERSRWTWAQVINAITLHRREGSWLDVGAGAGMLAALAHECGYDVVTMELRPQVAQALRDIGLEVLDGDAHDLADLAPARFDVVSLCDVLEHVPYPRRLLDSVWNGMRDDSVLFISCPNTDSLAWRFADQADLNPYWGEIEHYHNFSYRRLRRLLAEHGFEALSCSVSNRYRMCMDVVARRVVR